MIASQVNYEHGNPLELDERRVVSLYTKEKLSLEKLGKMFNCSPNTIRRRLEKYGVEIRSRETAQKVVSIQLDENEICRLYTEELMPIEHIAKIFNTSPSTIKRRLLHNGILLRSLEEVAELRKFQIDNDELVKLYEEGLSAEIIATKYELSPTTINTRLKEIGVELRKRTDYFEVDKRLLDKEWLYNEYIVENKSLTKICEENGFTSSSLFYWLSKWDIKKVEKVDIDKDKILELYVNGKSVKDIELETSVCNTTIYYTLRDAGINFSKDIPSEAYNKEYLEHNYIELKKSITAIANELGVGMTTIRNSLLNYGFQLRGNKQLKIEYEKGRIKPRSGADNPRFGKDATHGKGQWICLNGDKKYLRSSWEALVTKWLFLKGYNFKIEEVRFNLGDCTYKPDFFLYDEKNELIAIIEVKGWFKDEFIRKMMLFEALYPDIPYFVWDKEVIELIRQEVSEIWH